jgi:hypothetical protein
MFNRWIALTTESVQFCLEAQHVIGLRVLKVAAGGTAAQAEVVRMMTEKFTALAEGAATLAAGGSTQAVMRRYRTHVRANARRLSRR